ncbi:hypothetical protein [Bacillus rhizoplanae]|uniref:hypothetical protein n=1 Tax=Bacillus rhizoplanae TaxID=2880966 RepID=UPI003D2479F8
MPILKEFELDLPYIVDENLIFELMKQNNWEYYEATRFDYEKNWKQKRMKFRDEMRCIGSLYERFFKGFKFKNDKCWKIAVQCVDKITDLTIKTIGGVFEVQVAFEINNYFQLSGYEKKKYLLKTLKEGIDLVVEHEQWNNDMFDFPYSEIIKVDYINTWVWNTKFSPSRKYIAEVFCEHNISTFDISIIIKNRDKEEIKRVKLITDRPNEWSFVQYFGKLNWISHEEVALFNKKGTKHWSVFIY